MPAEFIQGSCCSVASYFSDLVAVRAFVLAWLQIRGACANLLRGNCTTKCDMSLRFADRSLLSKERTSGTKHEVGAIHESPLP